MPAVGGPWARRKMSARSWLSSQTCTVSRKLPTMTPDADHHRDRRGERGDDDGGARERGDQAAPRDQACRAGESLSRVPRKHSNRAGDEGRRNQGCRGDGE